MKIDLSNAVSAIDPSLIQQLRRLSLAFIISGVLSMVLLFIGINQYNPSTPVFSQVFFSLLAICLVVSLLSYFLYNKKVSEQIRAPFISDLCSLYSFKYSQECYFPVEEFNALSLFDRGTRVESEDEIKGSLSSGIFSCRELRVYKKADRKADGAETMIFSGDLYRFSLPKLLDFDFQIGPDFSESLLGQVGQKLQVISGRLSTKQVLYLDNKEFESYFKVESTNESATRKMLTPHFQKSLLSLRQSLVKIHPSATIYLKPHNEYLYLLISGSSDKFNMGFMPSRIIPNLQSDLFLISSVLEVADSLDYSNS